MIDYLQYNRNLTIDAQLNRMVPHPAKGSVITDFLRRSDDYNALEKAILKETDKDVLQFVSRYLDLKTSFQNTILTTEKLSFVDQVDFNHVLAIVNLKQISIKQLSDTFFRSINILLPGSGIYIGRVALWNKQLSGSYRKSKTELLGRLVYSGFEIVDVKEVDDLAYFIAKKIKDPENVVKAPAYYPMVKLSRIGQHGKIIGVYKFRTMHPYSEYIQDYLIRVNGYNEKGKPAGDFRITRWGNIIRRLWLDELPQLINVLKGEMKLVGIRPLSAVRYNDYDTDIRVERLNYKPGCIPPYVALNMPDEKGTMEAERIYIKEYNQHPMTTDLKYFFKAVYNILTNKIRSC
jgi:lipopolysaccharide/colanic/teichoic acid biosynthesis glycosyltransferase